MGAYSFQKRFVPYVLDGSKTHTIRGVRRHADKPGSTVHLFTGMRTKACQKLFSAPCVKVETILITESFDVIIDGVQLSTDELDSLAWRDGFRPEDGRSFSSMLKFWNAGGTEQRGTRESPNILPFEGHVIHWDYKRRIAAGSAVSQLERREGERDAS